MENCLVMKLKQKGNYLVDKYGAYYVMNRPDLKDGIYAIGDIFQLKETNKDNVYIAKRCIHDSEISVNDIKRFMVIEDKLKHIPDGIVKVTDKLQVLSTAENVPYVNFRGNFRRDDRFWDEYFDLEPDEFDVETCREISDYVYKMKDILFNEIISEENKKKIEEIISTRGSKYSSIYRSKSLILCEYKQNGQFDMFTERKDYSLCGLYSNYEERRYLVDYIGKEFKDRILENIRA